MIYNRGNIFIYIQLFNHSPRRPHFLDVIKQVAPSVHLAARLLLHLRVQLELWRLETEVRSLGITGGDHRRHLGDDDSVVNLIHFLDNRVSVIVDCVPGDVDELRLRHSLQRQSSEAS